MRKVLGALLSSRLPSSLYDELVEKSKLTSEFFASVDLVAPGYLMLSIEARASRGIAEAVSDRLTNYFAGLAQIGLDQETFQRLLNREIASLDNSAGNHRDYALKLGEEMLVGGFDAVADQKRALRGMRVEDMAASLARLASPIRAGTLLLKPKGG